MRARQHRGRPDRHSQPGGPRSICFNRQRHPCSLGDAVAPRIDNLLRPVRQSSAETLYIATVSPGAALEAVLPERGGALESSGVALEAALPEKNGALESSGARAAQDRHTLGLKLALPWARVCARSATRLMTAVDVEGLCRFAGPGAEGYRCTG